MSDELNEVVQPQVDEVPQPEETAEETVEEVDVAALQEKLNREAEARRQITARAQRAEAEKKALEIKLQAAKGNAPSLDVEDYIDISASLEGLDSKEKEYLAQQHKYTGKPLREIRNDENFLLWQSAHRQKVEKEKLTLKPSSAQAEADRPKSVMDKIRAAKSFEEKEKLLTEAGLYKAPRPRADRIHIGRPM